MLPTQTGKTKLIIPPVSRTAGHTQVGYIERKGADTLLLICSASSIAGTGVASATGGSFSIGEATDTNVSNATTIVANETAIKFEQMKVYVIDLRGKDEVIHVTATAGTAGVSNETQLFSVTGTLLNLEEGPTAAAGLVTGLTNNEVLVVN